MSSSCQSPVHSTFRKQRCSYMTKSMEAALGMDLQCSVRLNNMYPKAAVSLARRLQELLAKAGSSLPHRHIYYHTKRNASSDVRASFLVYQKAHDLFILKYSVSRGHVGSKTAQQHPMFAQPQKNCEQTRNKVQNLLPRWCCTTACHLHTIHSEVVCLVQLRLVIRP